MVGPEMRAMCALRTSRVLRAIRVLANGRVLHAMCARQTTRGLLAIRVQLDGPERIVMNAHLLFVTE